MLQSFIAFFMFGFSYYKRPWMANRPTSKTGMGIGAFNMLTKKDIMLSERMKRLKCARTMI
ncbi:hypothetical protein [Cytobacillus solani]|uniref:hypothetical protein n=1 Tax=Cytobacillus solani TaxID=1637975 RepID=UPI000ADAEC98